MGASWDLKVQRDALRQGNLEYVCDMLHQLRELVPSHTGPLLPRLIDMACLEAKEHLLHLDPDNNDTRPPA